MKSFLLLLATLNSAFVLSVFQSSPDNDYQQCVGYALDFERLQELSSNDIESLMGSNPLQATHVYSRSKVQNIVQEESGSNQVIGPQCLGSRHRLQETMEGVAVYGADILVTMGACMTQDTDYYGLSYSGSFLNTLSESGGIQALNGKTFASINVEKGYSPRKSKDEAIRAIAKHLSIDNLDVGEPDLEVFVSTGGDFLAYRSYSIIKDSAATDLVEVVVDAHDLSILSKCSLAGDSSEPYERRLRSKNNGQRNLQFNCQSCADHSTPIEWSEGETTSCPIKSLYLDNTLLSTTCTIGVNLNDNSQVMGPGPVDALYWNGTLDCYGSTDCSAVALPDCRDALSDIQFAGVAAMQYLQNNLGVNGGLSPDAQFPVAVKSYAHYQEKYCNAFFSPSTNSIYFGDCNCHTWAPLVAVDIVGHELYHGVTLHSSGLVYSGQSGGLNEAYSDIFGTVLEFYINDYEDPPDFTIAEQVGAVLRNLENPFYKSIKSVCDWYSGMNVHYASGALNKAYVKSVRACQANGCDDLRGCAMTVGKTFLYSNMNGLTKTSDFLDAAKASCNMVDEFFAVQKPYTGCSASQVGAFIREGWAAVDVAISSSGCVVSDTCPGSTPQPTPSPTRMPPTPNPTPGPTPYPTPNPTTFNPTPIPTPIPTTSPTSRPTPAPVQQTSPNEAPPPNPAPSVQPTLAPTPNPLLPTTEDSSPDDDEVKDCGDDDDEDSEDGHGGIGWFVFWGNCLKIVFGGGDDDNDEDFV